MGVLGREMIVERPFADADFGGDRIDPNRTTWSIN
jgi:hypothetical protein